MILKGWCKLCLLIHGSEDHLAHPDSARATVRLAWPPGITLLGALFFSMSGNASQNSGSLTCSGPSASPVPLGSSWPHAP